MSHDKSMSGQSDAGMSHDKMAGGASASDKHFMMMAAQGGMAEVEMGQLATQNASSDDVKKFGQRMVDDHTKANDQLKSLAAQKNVPLPTSLSAKDQATKDRLSKLQGAAFDKAYMKDMVTDHTKDVADFKKEAGAGKDSDVKSFASQTLPTLEDHLSNAKTVSGGMMAKGGMHKDSGMKACHPQQ
ncbi:MAG: DUF4142 domain-containing protein [Acidobacteriales bacterium]|nr:DUF4142 domain-containing protein [Terriglobales bacterium]